MKKLLSLLLAVCLLAALAMPTMAAKVDLSAIAEDAINELAKYNSTPVGEKFNAKTMMGYVFGDLCADDTYFKPDNRWERYYIPFQVAEDAFKASFANAEEALTYMSDLVLDDFSFEYTSVQKNVLTVFTAGQYVFSKYHLNRTELVKGHPKKSGSGFVIETTVPTWTVNGYTAAGSYTYKVYATNNSGSIVEYTIKWGGADVQFVSTKAVSAVPAGVVAPGTQKDLATSTTKKPAPTTTTTTKKDAPTTTTTKAPIAGLTTVTAPTTTTTTEAVDDGQMDIGAGEAVTTTTANGETVVTRPADADTNEQDTTTTGSDTTILYVIIAAVLGVLIVGIVIAVVIVIKKQKKN